MRSKFLLIIIVAVPLFFPMVNFGQAPDLGTAAGFVLFTTTGAVGNTGISHITGNVGANTGDISGFGNVDGVMDNVNGATAQASGRYRSTWKKQSYFTRMESVMARFFWRALVLN